MSELFVASVKTADSLAVVQSILNGIEVGPQQLLTLTSSTSSTPIEINLSDVVPTIPSKAEESSKQSSASPRSESEPSYSKSSSTSHLSLPTFADPRAALSYLCRHAFRYLKVAQWNAQSQFISRSYLHLLLKKLLSWNMFQDAETLVSAMEQVPGFAPSGKIRAFLDQLSPPGTVERICSHIKAYESIYKSVPDAFLVQCFEPFLQIQSMEAIEMIYDSLRKPSTVARNIYIRALLAHHRIAAARSIFNTMLAEDDMTAYHNAAILADSNTFAIMMQYYCQVNDIKLVESTMDTLIKSKYYGAPKRIHFEIYLQVYARAQKPQQLISMSVYMLSQGIRSINESIAADLMWACVNTQSFSRGVELHASLEDSASFTSVKYLRGLLFCLTSHLSAHSPQFIRKIAQTRAKLDLAEAAQSDSDTKEARALEEAYKRPTSANFRNTHSSHKSSNNSTVFSSNSINPSSSHSSSLTFDKVMRGSREADSETMSPTELTKILRTISTGEHLDVDLVRSLINQFASEPSQTMIIMKHVVDVWRSEATIDLISLTMDTLVTAEEINTVWSWMQSLQLQPSAVVFAHMLRRLYLLVLRPYNHAGEPEQHYRRLTGLVEHFQSNYGLSLDWPSIRWYLQCLYRLQRITEALNLLEAKLPTNKEIMLASSLDFGTKYQIPFYIASDFYTWALTAGLAVELDPASMQEQLSSLPSTDPLAVPLLCTATHNPPICLGANHLRVLLTNVQLAKRRPLVRAKVKKIPRHLQEL